MGKTIEKILKNRNHVISGIVDLTNETKISDLKDNDTDVIIEFTSPESAYGNIKECIELDIPVVSGSTGWLNKKDDLVRFCKEKSGSFFYASNFSLGVNIFFKINDYLAKLMNGNSQYQVDISETHHTEKVDKPSGTAITLAEGIIKNNSEKSNWKLDEMNPSPDAIPIYSYREEGVPGTHIIKYESEYDFIEIKHLAKNRMGFALGAVMVAEWLPGKHGYFTMDDFLKI